MKKNTKTDTGKKYTDNSHNTDISVFFRDCILLNFMQNLLRIRFQMMPNSHDITALTHQVRDIFNEV